MNKERCKCCIPNMIDGGNVLAISRGINEWFGIDDFYFSYGIEEDNLKFTELGSWEGASSTSLAKFCPFCGRKVEDIKKDFRAFSKLNPKEHGHIYPKLKGVDNE